MRVRWNEIEPQFAGRVRACLLHTLPPPERLSPAWLLFSWIVSALFWPLMSGFASTPQGRSPLSGFP